MLARRAIDGSCGSKIASAHAARDERAILRSGASFVERGRGRESRPRNAAKRALVTARKRPFRLMAPERVGS